MKKLLIIYISFCLSFSQVFANGIPISSDNNSSVVCTETSTSDYFPVGDTAGKTVLTKLEINRDCNVTRTVQGSCLEWKEDSITGSLPTEAYHSFKSNDFSDSVGQLMAMMGAYDQLGHIWSGYNGYCVSGIQTDFNWVQDPMFWGTMLMSYFMDSGTFNAAADSVGGTVFESSLTPKFFTDSMIEVGSSASQDVIQNLGKCLMSSAFNLAAAVYSFTKDSNDNSGMDCDPVDEICDDANNGSDQGQIMTMDLTNYQDLIATIESENQNSNTSFKVSDFLDVIDDGSTTGIVVYRMVSKSSLPGIAGANMDQMNKMMEQYKVIMLEVNLAIMVAGIGSCLMGYNVGGISPPGGKVEMDAGRSLLKGGIKTAISVGSKFCGPFGPIVSAVGTLLTEIAFSFTPVDSCHSEKDAASQGSRHTKTQKALKYNLCRPTFDACAQQYPIFGGCSLKGFHFCCYDQMLTKVLVTQMKAELGRDWAHCTGITISDLNFISFRQCSTSEMQDGFDGATMYGIPVSSDSSEFQSGDGSDVSYTSLNPEDAFQYKHKCMDLTEFKDYLSSQMGTDIDPAVFTDYWNSLMTQNKAIQ